MNSSFAHLTVIELASVLAGPSAGMFFAELGAKVIKVENARTGGDVTRNWRAPGEARDGLSAYYCSINYGKETRLLDLQTAAARAEVHALVAGADVVITNFQPRVAAKLRMGIDTLRALNDRLIVAELQGFPDDPARPAFDVVLQAESGFLYMTGSSDGPPVKLPVALIDVLAAHQLKEGILLALLRRAQTGKGAHVRASLLESALAALVNQANNYLMADHVPQRMGSAHPNIAPYGDQFTTADGVVFVLAVGSDRQFAELCDILDLPAMASADTYRTNVARIAHRAALNRKLGEAIAVRDAEMLFDALAARRIPYGRIRPMNEVLSLPVAQRMIRREIAPGQQATARLSSLGFELLE